ncbi:hypothetical protein GYMLUDRAFT_706700 [Collybiopsis luxurians FD-317 M1]|uniref:NACHT domain-containing protein n=1 Tax=Collybiopsis luxurians FD-317 M1 TaxID=944289 RepID=A0A0D0CRB0_9AGAR|nr:hypothetical protein GYMLUDRAFT_706700 [Collybiopsis luxurians FD-317 M1]
MSYQPSVPAILASSAMSTVLATVAPTPPATSDFENLWAKALADYKDQTGLNFSQDQIAQFATCRSVDDVVRILETQSKGLEAFRKKGKNIQNVLRPVVRLVELFNDTGAEAASAAGVPGGKAIFVAFGVLLTAGKGVTEVYNTLQDLAQELEDALFRIGMHLGSNPGLRDIVIQMLVQVLHVIGFLMKYQDSKSKEKKALLGNLSVFGQRTKDYMKSLSGNKEVQEAFQNLNKLTKKEELLRIAEIHKKVDQIDTMQMDEKIRKWLSPPNVSQYHNTIYKTHQEGTGEWLFKPNSKFSQWKQAESSILWIYGKPGSGKSVLCSTIIEALRKEPGLAFFYFDFRDSTKQTVYGVLSSLISQLASHSQKLKSHLTQFYQDHCSSCPEHPDDDLLFKCLTGMLQVLPGVYMVCDALDECPKATREEYLFPLLEKLIGFNYEGLHILITSRPEQDIRKGLLTQSSNDSDLSNQVIYLTLDLDETNDHAHDIDHYIKEKVSTMEEWSQSLKKTTQELLITKASGI